MILMPHGCIYFFLLLRFPFSGVANRQMGNVNALRINIAGRRLCALVATRGKRDDEFLGTSTMTGDLCLLVVY